MSQSKEGLNKMNQELILKNLGELRDLLLADVFEQNIFETKVRKMVKDGKIDVNESYKNHIGWVPLIFTAAANGRVGAIRILKELGADVNQTNKDGWSAITLAAQSGHTETVRVLVEELGVDVNQTNAEGSNIIMIAAENGHTETVRVLGAELGANVNHVNHRGWTAITLAALRYHTETIRVLVKELGVDVNQTNTEGSAAIMLVALRGDTETVRVLVEELGVDVNKATAGGYTAITLAASRGHAKTVRVLVEELGADVNQTNAEGALVIMVAALSCHTETVKTLLKMGATIDIPDNEFNNFWGVELSAIKLLIKAGCKFPKSALDNDYLNLSEFAIECDKEFQDLSASESQIRLDKDINIDAEVKKEELKIKNTEYDSILNIKIQKILLEVRKGTLSIDDFKEAKMGDDAQNMTFAEILEGVLMKEFLFNCEKDRDSVITKLTKPTMEGIYKLNQFYQEGVRGGKKEIRHTESLDENTPHNNKKSDLIHQLMDHAVHYHYIGSLKNTQTKDSSTQTDPTDYTITPTPPKGRATTGRNTNGRGGFTQSNSSTQDGIGGVVLPPILPPHLPDDSAPGSVISNQGASPVSAGKPPSITER
jgi:ankyrin repeat protein